MWISLWGSINSSLVSSIYYLQYITQHSLYWSSMFEFKTAMIICSLFQALSAWYFQSTTCHLEYYSMTCCIWSYFSCKTFWQTADKDLSVTAILFSYLAHKKKNISLQTKLFCDCAKRRNKPSVSNATCQMDLTDTDCRG